MDLVQAYQEKGEEANVNEEILSVIGCQKVSLSIKYIQGCDHEF